jgi:DNA-binding LacI/PurR family transcriptional regulator
VATREPSGMRPSEPPAAFARTSGDEPHGGAPAGSVPTMRDVARATGVSQSTVSRVLSGAPTTVPIAPSTRERVVAAARQLGYRPNPLARGLRGSRTMLLGVIVRDITDPFFTVAIEAVSIEASRLGYNVVLGHAHGRADEALALWGILEARHCDAILMLGDMRDQPGLIEDLKETRVPVVALWHGSRSTGVPTVTVDNRAGIAMVVEHLAGLGHRAIAFVGPRRLGDIREREEAWRAGISGLGVRVPEAYVEHPANEYGGGVEAMERLMRLPEPPTAVVCATDVLAIGALHVAQRRGLHVPHDISITGFDDIPVAAVSVPALTTVRMPVREMIAVGVRMAIGDPEALPVSDEDPHPLLQPSLVVRTSTGPAADEDRRRTS